MEHARDCERDLLCPARRRRLESLAARVSATEYGFPLVLGFRDTCLFEKINHALVIADRERVGREASPSAASTVKA